MAEKRVKRTHMKPFLHTQHESGVRSTVRPTARAVERLDTVHVRPVFSQT